MAKTEIERDTLDRLTGVGVPAELAKRYWADQGARHMMRWFNITALPLAIGAFFLVAAVGVALHEAALQHAAPQAERLDALAYATGPTIGAMLIFIGGVLTVNQAPMRCRCSPVASAKSRSLCASWR